MSVRYDEARIEIDWMADFVGWRTMKFTVKFTDQQDPLLLALYARYQKQMAEKIAQAGNSLGDADVMF